MESITFARRGFSIELTECPYPPYYTATFVAPVFGYRLRVNLTAGASRFRGWPDGQSSFHIDLGCTADLAPIDPPAVDDGIPF